MIYLLEGLWYAAAIVLRIAFWPIIIGLGLFLLSRLGGKIFKKKEKKEEKKK